MSTLDVVRDARRVDTAELVKQLLDCYATNLPVRRIAVIGNGPLAPSRPRQQAIDSADLVIRCNSFLVDEPAEEPCVGTRTDVVLLARATRITKHVFDRYWTRLYAVNDAGNLRVANPPQTPPSWPTDLGCLPIPNASIGLPLKRLVSPETDGYGIVPTTGTLAVYLAYCLYPDATTELAGFSFLDEPDQKSWQHRYGTAVPVHRTHLIDRESALIHSWIDAGRVARLP